MMVWSASSWNLWKSCPAKYQIKHLQRWADPTAKRDPVMANLAVPGLVVDKLLQFWLHRREFDSWDFLASSFDMVWAIVENEVQPEWKSEDKRSQAYGEAISGLQNAIRIMNTIDFRSHTLIPQAKFFVDVMPAFGVRGSADLLMIDPSTNIGTLIDFKNSHSRERVTKDQLVIYQIGLEKQRGLRIERGGYLLFHNKLQEWKWFVLHDSFRKRMLQRLSEATEDVEKGEFAFNWNQFTCPRFCDVRFSCELFQQISGIKG